MLDSPEAPAAGAAGEISPASTTTHVDTTTSPTRRRGCRLCQAIPISPIAVHPWSCVRRNLRDGSDRTIARNVRRVGLAGRNTQLLIWGFRSLLKVLGVGEFHCPTCQADTSYRLVRPRRWFTFFFIPIIPLKWGESFVQCDRCKGNYRETILNAPTNKQFGYMLALGARAMYAKVVATDYAHSEHMIDRAVAQLQPFTDAGYNEANLVADMAAFRDRPLAEFLSPLGSNMLMEGRESLLSGFVSYVHSEGTPSPEVEAIVVESATNLGMTAAHLAGIVATTTGAARRPDSL